MGGWRLREGREWYGVSLPDFSRFLGISEARYRNWEQEGERFRAPNDLQTMVRLAEALGVTEGWLVGRPTANRWNEEVDELRHTLRHQLRERPDLQGLSNAPRVAHVLDLIRRFKSGWVPAHFPWGLCGVDLRTLERMLAGITPVTDTVLHRLDQFTLLGDWLVSGDPEDLTSPEPGSYEEDVLALLRNRIPAGFVARKVRVLAALHQDEARTS